MERERFDELVAEAVAELPQEFLRKLENVAIVVEDRPSLAATGGAKVPPGHSLLGLYEGVPRTMRTSRYGLVPPDKITLFRKAIEARAQQESQVKVLIQETLEHEIAHHFGIGDRQLDHLRQHKRPT